MHIVNSQVWQAVDGQIFLLEKDCRVYEQDLLHVNLTKLLADVGGYNNIDARNISMDIIQNFDKIKRIMQTGSAEEQQY